MSGTTGAARRTSGSRTTGASRLGHRNLACVALLAAFITSACTIDLRPGADIGNPPEHEFRLGGPLQDTTTPPPRRRIIQPEGVARLPVFSTAVRTGNLLFLSGQIGTRPGVSPPQIVEGGVQAETRQTMDNIRTVLAADSLSLDDLVKCTVFLADIADYAAVNEVYAEYFPQSPPARSAIAGSGLALGARVEVECIAAYPRGR